MPNLKRLHAVHTAIAAGTLMCGLTSAAAETRSSTQDRERFVLVTRKLENAPLNSSLQEDRKWALEWLTNAPDVSVTVCADPLGGVVTSDYAYAPEILVQYMFSMATSVIEHSETAQDPNAIQLEGVEGALNAYRSILMVKPEAKSPELDGVLEAQDRGELPEYVRKAFDRCKSKDSEALSE